MSEYLTVKEFAIRAGVTPQAVYKQLDNRLQGYWKEHNGKKVLSAEALPLFESQGDDNSFNNNFSTVVNALNEQLREKDKQIAEKDKQIEALTRALNDAHQLANQSQQLQANSEKKLLQLEAPKKRRWWPFGKNDDDVIC